MTLPMCPHCHDIGCLICHNSLKRARFQEDSNNLMQAFFASMQDAGIPVPQHLDQTTFGVILSAIEYGRKMERHLMTPTPPAPGPRVSFLELDPERKD